MSKTDKKIYPFVSVCTPTYNRRPFIETMFNCFKNQTYPKSRIEWIIVDDGTDKIRDLIAKSKIPQIKYIELEKKCFLGEKRNIMHSHCSPKSKYIVYMDDDDYYPPERIEHAVERLESNPQALCAGASEIYIFFKHIQKMYQCGPYGPNHATAGTFAFRTELLKQTKYENGAALAEEKAFLKDYTIPFVQLDPMKTILVFSHIHNTFDKKKMLENPHPDFCKESPKTIDMFIKFKHENNIKKFFLEDIEPLLNNYKPGEPTMKPDVLEQIKKIEKEREELNKKNGAGQIMMNRPGEPPVPMSPEQILQLIQESQKEIERLTLAVQSLQEEIKKKDRFIETIKNDKEKDNMTMNPLLNTSITPDNNNITITDGRITMNRPGNPAVLMTPEQILKTITDSQEENKKKDRRIDLLKQKIELDKDEFNKKINEQSNMGGMPQIMMNRPGEAPVPMKPEEIIQLIVGSQEEIKKRDTHIELLKSNIIEMEKRMRQQGSNKGADINNSQSNKVMYDFSNITGEKPQNTGIIKEKSKSDPEVFVNVSD